MKRFLISVAAGLLLVLALVLPVAAVGPGCSTMGAATASLAKELHPVGQVFSAGAKLGPGTTSGIVANSHATMCAHP